MATAKEILTLDKSKSILQRIGAMRSSVYCNKAKDKLNLHTYYKGYGGDKLVDVFVQKTYNKTVNKGALIYVMNDFGLELITRLESEGFTNVWLLCTEEDDDLYNMIKFMLKREFNFDRIIRQETTMADFDLLLTNPPYEIGGDIITEAMKHCKDAVVLMPASKYKKNKLFKNVTSFEVLPWKEYHDCFEDADTHIHIATLAQNTDNYDTWQEFELNTYNQKWIKYYRENLRRKASWTCTYRVDQEHPLETTFLLTIRTPVDGVHKTKNCLDWEWNIDNVCDYSHFLLTSTGAQAVFSTFSSAQERNNIVHWWYSSSIATYLARGINKQGTSESYSFLPKVDWTRSWTDEEILRDYGYTEDEIKELLS